MQRTTAIGIGLIVALGLGLTVVLGRSTPPRPAPATTPAASHSAPAVAAPAATTSAAAAPAPSASAAAAEDVDEDARFGEGFDTLPDGRKVPELPASAPKQVSIGIVVVAYQGAQLAQPDARSKKDAKTRAEGLVEEAKRNFTAAVAQGDRGSTADAGHVPRDVLEPAPEYAIFSLSKGEVSQPIDTPRGYWIVRRND